LLIKTGIGYGEPYKLRVILVFAEVSERWVLDLILLGVVKCLIANSAVSGLVTSSSHVLLDFYFVRVFDYKFRVLFLLT
jgi:hypothetical protein